MCMGSSLLKLNCKYPDGTHGAFCLSVSLSLTHTHTYQFIHCRTLNTELNEKVKPSEPICPIAKTYVKALLYQTEGCVSSQYQIVTYKVLFLLETI